MKIPYLLTFNLVMVVSITMAQSSVLTKSGKLTSISNATTTSTGTIQLAGDLTGTATTPTIATDAVTTAKVADSNITYGKIQNVSATDKVLGRVSAGTGVVEEIATTGTGNVVRATSPTLVTPALGTPSSAVLSNATGLPLTTGVTGILAINNGGTGSTTVSGALSNLGGQSTENLSTDMVVDANSTTKYPSVKTIKDYVDTFSTPDATTLAKGKIQLAGDLSGTATLPTIAANAVTTAKVADSNITYAKIQNVSATDKVLGRISVGSGVVEEIATTGTGNVVRATSPTLVTPNIGVATATSVNKLAIIQPANSATLVIADGKTLTSNNSIALTGTDATTMSFPTTSATIARTDAAQTFTGAQTFATSIGINTGSTAPANKLQITSGTSGASGLRFSNVNNTLTPSVTTNNFLSVDANGDVIYAKPNLGLTIATSSPTSEQVALDYNAFVTRGNGFYASDNSAALSNGIPNSTSWVTISQVIKTAGWFSQMALNVSGFYFRGGSDSSVSSTKWFRTLSVDANSQFKIDWDNTTNHTITMNNVNNGPIAFSTNNTERVRLLANGNLGIGTTAPNATLDVRTAPTSTSNPGTGFIGIGTTSLTASSAGVGAIKYNVTSGLIEYSNGTSWLSLAPGSGAPIFAQFSNNTAQTFTTTGTKVLFQTSVYNSGGGITIASNNTITLPAGRVFRVDLNLGWINMAGNWARFGIHNASTDALISNSIAHLENSSTISGSGKATAYIDTTAGSITIDVRYEAGGSGNVVLGDFTSVSASPIGSSITIQTVK